MRPLSDLRVVDATSYVSGPFAALCLADLGARVLKIEPPRGDPMRRFGVLHNDVSFTFAVCNGNKTSRTLNLKLAEDVDRFHEELSEADVLITNWRPGVAEEMGFNVEEVRQMYPLLVWVRISGYGQVGPFANLPAFDAILQARSGIARARDGEAKLAPGYLADKVSGLLAAQAAIAAIHGRDSTKTGAIVDVAMLDAMAYFNGPDLFAGDLMTSQRHPEVMRHIGAARPLATKDGWIIVSPVSGRQLKALLAAVGHPEWSEELRRAGDPTVLIEEMNRLLETTLVERTTSDWEATFSEADVPASAALTLEEHLVDAQVLHNRIYHEVNDPVFGAIRRLRHPALFDSEPVETDDLPIPALEIRE